MATKFPSVTLQGNILTFDALEQIAAGKDATDMPRQTAREYGFASEQELSSEIQAQWAVAKTQYTAFQQQVERLKDSDTGTTQTRSGWVIPLLSLWGYELKYTRAQTIDDRSYAISHAASVAPETGFGDSRAEDAPSADFPVHIVGANQSLDKRGTAMRMSPHALVQEFLNRHESLYAIVTNGKSLRLLRDSANLTKLSYVEFDLTRMFGEDLYVDFALLYRLLHVSRLPEEPSAGADSLLEKYHQEALKSGSRIRDELSAAVERGIVMLANGLLTNPDNGDLRQWASNQPDAAEQYYEALLKLIYRLLFLMVIEERDLIYPKEEKKVDDGLNSLRGPQQMAHRDVYYAFYSLKRLRGLAANLRLANEREYDLWESLLNTFALFEPGGTGAKLGIGPLAGSLFGTQALNALHDARVNNRVLLECLRGLSQFDNGQGGIMPVNYASLDVEEFGSVYEGLLDYDAHINEKTLVFQFVKGKDRSSSGSHYTPDELVQPLIQHSLEHLIADRTVAPSASQEKRDEAVRQLLKLKVADVTCGSGHILLAAARRIGFEVARLREEAEQPPLTAIREGTRDAIQNCIYGVDRNPLAVELCKVALWLEAHVPGKPLGFLDHRIKCGDAIVGVGRLEDLQKGISTEAFKSYSAEEKATAAALRKRNKAERKLREAGNTQLSLMNGVDTVRDRLAAFRQNFTRFAEMPERTVEEIEAKEAAYRQLSQGHNWYIVKTICDVRTAQFFIPKTDEKLVVTDSQYFEMMQGAYQSSQAAGAAVGESAERRFFHWFLEYPEVFAGGGFDCVLGNPPFLGGQKISTSEGKDYLNYIHIIYEPAKGTTDLVAYFFRRIYDILLDQGFLSLIATNTIAQGDTREGGLATLRDQGGTINHAVRSMKWPGVAAVEVSLVTVYRGDWNQSFILNLNAVDQITTYLDDQEYIGDPYPLAQNEGKSFVGSYVLGKGFIMEPEEAQALIDRNPKNKDVLFPYLNGSDLNSRPDQSPSRWVINFFDWPERRMSEEEWGELPSEARLDITNRIEAGRTIETAPPNYEDAVATDYPDCYQIIERTVKPERQRWKLDARKEKIIGTYALRAPLPERWWMYGEKRPGLYEAVSKVTQALTVALTSKTVGFAFVPSRTVWSHATGVVSDNRHGAFACLQSTLHYVWAWKYGSSMKNDLRYTPSDVFESFPFPSISAALEEGGRSYDDLRSEASKKAQLGLTRLYQEVSNASLDAIFYHHVDEATLSISAAGIERVKGGLDTRHLYRHITKIHPAASIGEALNLILKLRKRHARLDQAVLAAYGWDVSTKRWGPAIKLRHDFYEVDYLPEKDNARYTIHPEARREVLKRLLLLNHEIHEAETRKNADGTIGVDYAVIDAEKITALMLEQVKTWCPQADQLHWKTLKFLCTGEDLLPSLEKSLTKSYKPFVTAYASALENELLERVFVKFNEEFQSRYRLDNEEREDYLKAQAAIDPAKLGRFVKELKNGSTKYELGTMQYILGLVHKPSGSTLATSELLQDFRAFVLENVNQVVLDPDFLRELNTFSQTYRNVAAHTGEIDKGMAEGCEREVKRMINALLGGVKAL